MQYKGTYRGVSNIKRKAIKNRVKKISLSLVFIIVFIITMFLATFKLLNKFENNIALSKEEIKSYIDITDKLSEVGYQLNWQEVASINSALNNGDFEINNENINNIANSFFKKDTEGNIIGINSFKVAIKNLDLDNEREALAKENLEKIKGNYINEELINDRNKLGFIESISAVALDNYKNYGILPSITISQAILESGWGESTLSSKYNNLFGIKADSRWNGKKVEMETKEKYDDVIVGAFRAYDNVNSSIEDHGRFLYENERYGANGLFQGKTYIYQAQALEDAGYSTAKDEDGNLIYADKLIRVIQENNLMFYDTNVERK